MIISIDIQTSTYKTVLKVILLRKKTKYKANNRQKETSHKSKQTDRKTIRLHEYFYHITLFNLYYVN